MKEIGAIFVVSISEIRTVQLAAIKRRYIYFVTHHFTFRRSHDAYYETAALKTASLLMIRSCVATTKITPLLLWLPC